MTALVAEFAAVALFLAVGGDTEEAMREHLRMEAALVSAAMFVPPC